MADEAKAGRFFQDREGKIPALKPGDRVALWKEAVFSDFDLITPEGCDGLILGDSKPR